MTEKNSSAPIPEKSRISSIDTLRGFALLGILLMNIIGFAFPFASYFNPAFDGATEGVNLATYAFMDVFAEGAMRTIFSMLFGAGLLIFIAKPGVNEEHIKSLYYRRTLLLVVFGMIDAYLFLWLGDILFVYGMAGLILYFFRHMSPWKLCVTAAFILSCLTGLHTFSHTSVRTLSEEIKLIEALPEGTVRSEAQLAKVEEWESLLADQFVSEEQQAQEIELRQSGYLTIVSGLAPINFFLQTGGLLAGTLWDALAMMLLGMAMMKWQILSAQRSFRFYWLMAVIGFIVGLGVNVFEVHSLIASGFEIHWSGSMRPSYEVGRLFMALAYIASIMLVCKYQLLLRVQLALAAVGKMALTNYLSQSIICNTLFMGFGFGLAGQLERHQIYYVVLGIWIFQLIFSVFWLQKYRFGPVEWLWRSLTYGNKQPLRINA